MSTAANWETTRDLMSGPMRAALGRLDPTTRQLCGYQLGLWDEHGVESADGAGKGARPALALLSARAAGADPAAAFPAAVAVELVHNFSLIHDDLMDRDRQRRNRTTVWAQWGSSPAILAGDAMLSLANEVLAEAPSPTTAWAVRCLNATTRRLIAGQTADLAFETRDDVGIDECMAMASDKTAALFGCAASLGAVLVDAPAGLAMDLAEFGQRIGLAFQVVDDMLGIWGEPELTGKPVGSDLRSHKKSMPVVAAMDGSGAASAELRDCYLGTDETGDDWVLAVTALVDRAGGRRWAEDTVARETTGAIAVLDRLGLPGPVDHELRMLAEQLSRRER